MLNVNNSKPILASASQRGNPVLRLLPIKFDYSDESEAFDFLISPTTALLFLSIRYHNLHPEYLISRIENLKRASYRFLGLLVLVDDVNCELALLRIQTLAVSNKFTTLVAFSEEEAARYLESFKIMQNRGSEDLEGRKQTDHAGRCTEALGRIRGVNKSDTKTLLRNFKSMGSIMQASVEELAMCHGIGEKKVVRMHAAFNKPFFANQQVPVATTTTTTDRFVHVLTHEQSREEESEDEVEIID